MLIPVSIRANAAHRAAMLVECLESIRIQTFTDYEVIIKDANPGETIMYHDNVRNAIRALYPKVNFIAFADKSIVSGLNQAYWWATGDIIHWIGGDDMLGDKYTLDFVHKLFVDKTSPAWLYGSTGCVNEDGTEGPWGITPFATLEETLIHNRMGQPATYWNKAMANRLGYFRYNLASDYDYWCRCYRIAPPMYTTRITGIGRRWSQSASFVDSATVELEAAAISVEHTAAHERGEAPQFVPYAECEHS